MATSEEYRPSTPNSKDVGNFQTVSAFRVKTARPRYPSPQRGL